jgi:hypothetical protein
MLGLLGVGKPHGKNDKIFVFERLEVSSYLLCPENPPGICPPPRTIVS